MSRRAERRAFDDKLATRDVTFLYSALKAATESARDRQKQSFRGGKVATRPNFVTFVKGRGGELFIRVRGEGRGAGEERRALDDTKTGGLLLKNARRARVVFVTSATYYFWRLSYYYKLENTRT